MESFEDSWEAKFGRNGTHSHRGFVGTCPIRFKDRSAFNIICQLLRIERKADRAIHQTMPVERFRRRLKLSSSTHRRAMTMIYGLQADVNTLNTALRDREESR